MHIVCTEILPSIEILHEKTRTPTWVDLRAGSRTFGQVFTCTLDPSKAIFVPRGVGNSFQALEDGTAYTYLVNAHWSAELKKTYTFVNLADPVLGIRWPIPLDQCELSEADLHHPMAPAVAACFACLIDPVRGARHRLALLAAFVVGCCALAVTQPNAIFTIAVLLWPLCAWRMEESTCRLLVVASATGICAPRRAEMYSAAPGRR